MSVERESLAIGVIVGVGCVPCHSPAGHGVLQKVLRVSIPPTPAAMYWYARKPAIHQNLAFLIVCAATRNRCEYSDDELIISELGRFACSRIGEKSAHKFMKLKTRNDLLRGMHRCATSGSLFSLSGTILDVGNNNPNIQNCVRRHGASILSQNLKLAAVLHLLI